MYSSRTLQRCLISSFCKIQKISSVHYCENVGRAPINTNHVKIPQCTANSIQQRWCSQNSQANMDTVNFEYVKKMTNNDDVLIVDVREPDEVKEHGKIPNSLNIPLGNITSAFSASEKEFRQIFNRPKPKENSEIIFYCMIGKRSATAQQNVQNLGYKNTKNYLGSWTDWAAKTK